MAAWKPAYLIHGDAHGRIAERRGRLRAMAEEESGVEGVEVLEGDASTPEAVAAALNAMTFAIGRRFVIADGVERWKDADVEAQLAPTLKDVPPDTTVAFFAREDGRAKAPAKLAAIVKKVGAVTAEMTPKGKDLPQWAIGEAQRLGVTLEGGAAQALVTSVGERQQRLLRELEKLAIEHGPGATLGLDEVESAAHSAERQVWGLVDAFVARRQHGRDARVPGAARAGRIHRPAGPADGPARARRARDRRAAGERRVAGADQGVDPRQPVADRTAHQAGAGTDADSLRTALEALADLEIASRGGSELDDDTAALRAIAMIAA